MSEPTGNTGGVVSEYWILNIGHINHQSSIMSDPTGNTGGVLSDMFQKHL